MEEHHTIRSSNGLQWLQTWLDASFYVLGLVSLFNILTRYALLHLCESWGVDDVSWS